MRAKGRKMEGRGYSRQFCSSSDGLGQREQKHEGVVV